MTETARSPISRTIIEHRCGHMPHSDTTVDSGPPFGNTSSRTSSAPETACATAVEATAAICEELGATGVTSDDDVARVSLVGAGMKTHPGVTATTFETLAAEGINIDMISTSTIRISCIVRTDVAEQAVRALHRAFELS